MSVTGSVSVSYDLVDTGTSDQEESTIRITRAFASSFVDGAGAGAINAIWQDIRSLTDGGTENLDVAPTPTSGRSGIVTFARIKVWIVYAPSTNTTNITVIRHATTGVPVFNVVSSGVVLKPGGVFAFVDPSATGVAVTGGASDLFTITNSAGAAATYGVVVGGALT